MQRYQEMVTRLLQIAIGGIILGSAVGKALDLSGFADVLETYHAFPQKSLFLIALAVTVFEFLLGSWMLIGWRLAISASIAAAMNLVYAGWMTVTLLRGLHLENCGCFGVFFPRPLTWISPIEDLVMVMLCGLLAYAVRR